MVTPTAGQELEEAVASLRLPLGRLAELHVAPAEFAAVWLMASAWAGDPKHNQQYAQGVLAACEWVAGRPGVRTPLHGERESAQPTRISMEHQMAAATARGRAGAVQDVPPMYAAGVAATTGWLLGVAATSPVAQEPAVAA